MVDTFQAVVAFSAFGIQLAVTLLASPLKRLFTHQVWVALIGFNFLILVRRAMSIAEVVFRWNTQQYETTTVLLGLGISLFALFTLIQLRKHVTAENHRRELLAKQVVEEEVRLAKIASATLALTEALKCKPLEETDAYKMALHLNAKYASLLNVNNGMISTDRLSTA